MWPRKCVLWECDSDKWAITEAIFACHICGRRDPRLALLMPNVRCERWACQQSRLGRRRRPFWHVIHHWFHLAATAVSRSPLSEAADPAEDAQQVIKYLSGISDIHPVSLTEDKKTLFFLKIRWFCDIFINKKHLMLNGVTSRHSAARLSCQKARRKARALQEADTWGWGQHGNQQGQAWITYSLDERQHGWTPRWSKWVLNGGLTTVKLQPSDPFSSPRLLQTFPFKRSFSSHC